MQRLVRMKCRIRTALLVPFLLALGTTVGSAQSNTRIEQNDPSVVYSGNWYSNSSSNNTGALAALTNTRGARLSLSFTGSGINWIGTSDRWSGIATVYVDGKMTLVNTYSASDRSQQVLFGAHGLGSGPHTISIEVMHERGPSTEGSWVWVDAFEIVGGAPIPGGITATAGHIEDHSPSISFSGRWYTSQSSQHSGGTAVLAMDAGFKLTLNFEGTGISWIGYRDEWSGLAHVYVDGAARTTVDCFQSAAAARTVLYTINGLAPGPHTLTIEVTGTRNASANGAWIWVDAFDVVQSDVRR
jgi:hypothetical protein